MSHIAEIEYLMNGYSPNYLKMFNLISNYHLQDLNKMFKQNINWIIYSTLKILFHCFHYFYQYMK